ncbi:J domain-containing protein [Halorussus salilacus]|uniref:J domain-containing protein n=1 Tax=Halorussus salilacus TaxID=2953750 RepID=UPI00209EE451|nr:J domain-containing protein [Halorussus salilacus]USZ69645.1 J domain-containing protein [Halorussus salilacus]
MPEWLVVGLWLSAAVGVLIGAIFAVGSRLYPTRTVETTRASGEGRRRMEIRQYLSTIGEEFAEDHFVEGQHVAFYLPERDVAITFDARAYFRIERSPTYAVLVEHEMPGVHLGDRLPFETPELDDGEDRVDPVEAAFAVLGVPENATLSEVKRAYRERIKEVHPDQGGDRERFQQVREAYTTVRKRAN